MTIRAWRIIKTKHSATAFTGGGAKTYGGRWNSVGTAAVYTASSTSLAILEMLVHLQAQHVMRRYVLCEVSFDETLMTTVEVANLPKSWRRFPSSKAARQVGDEWVEKATSAVLRLPSVIVPSEWNYMLNPAHPDFPQIKIGPKQPIKFDPRLVKTSSR